MTKTFSDVTLVCEDGQQVTAHKVILAASSPFFHKILKTNKQLHPIIYMRGVRFEELVAIIDFLYHGEASIYQENLDVFLNLAEELKLKGLTERQDDIKHNEPSKYLPKAKETTTKTENENLSTSDKYSQINVQDTSTSEGTVVIPGHISSEDLNGLDEQIKTMMATGQTNLGRQGFARICTVCGKEGALQNIKDHIEANHIEGLSIPCNLCERTFRSRPSLRMH